MVRSKRVALLHLRAQERMNPPRTITTEEIFQQYRNFKAGIRSSPFIAKAAQVEQDQKRVEQELVSKATGCALADHLKVDLQERLGQLDANELQRLVQQQFYNYSVIQATTCTAEALYYVSPHDQGSPHLNERIREFLRGLRRIGSPSVEGYAFSSDLSPSSCEGKNYCSSRGENLFVVKVPQNPERDNLAHEMLVGLYGTNTLRAMGYPNFAYIYGGWRCSPPYLVNEQNNEEKVVTWCTSEKNAVNYVLYENIAPAITIREYVKTCSSQRFLAAYLQIILSLRKAHEVADFTHYDLHSENILMRGVWRKDLETQPPLGADSFQIPYELEPGKRVYLLTDRVATIIDYGYAHIQYNERHYGKSGLVPFFIFPEESWPMHDAYKLLSFLLWDAHSANNREVVREATKIWRYFNATEDPLDVLPTQFQLRYSLPPTDKTKNMSLDSLLTHIMAVSDTSFLRPIPGDEPILWCDNMCLETLEALKRIGLDNPLQAGSILDFYELHRQLLRRGDLVQLRDLTQSFNYDVARDQHHRQTEEMADFLEEKRSSLVLIDLKDYYPSEIFTLDTMDRVRRMYDTIAEMVDVSLNYKIYMEAGTGVAQEFNDPQEVEELNKIHRHLDMIMGGALEEAVRLVQKNDERLDILLSDPNYRSLITEELGWYTGGRELLHLAIGGYDSFYSS